MMTVDTASTQLWSSLHELREAVMGLQLAVGDAPDANRLLIVDSFADAAAELGGAVEHALDEIAGKGAILGTDSVPSPGRRELVRCYSRLTAARKSYFEDIAQFARREDLESLGYERGRVWGDWAASVGDAAEQCRPRLEAACDGVVACLDELAEHVTAYTR